MINTPIVDEGTYMFDPKDGSGQWFIRHPQNSYTPNDSEMYDVYIISSNDQKGNMPLIDLGSFKNLKQAQLHIERLHKENRTYYNLKTK